MTNGCLGVSRLLSWHFSNRSNAHQIVASYAEARAASGLAGGGFRGKWYAELGVALMKLTSDGRELAQYRMQWLYRLRHLHLAVYDAGPELMEYYADSFTPDLLGC